MNSKILTYISLLPTLVLLLASRSALAEAGPLGLTGTWLVSVQQYDCSSDAAIGMPFQSFLTFGLDRTLIETTANTAFAPGQRGPGHGFWERTAHDSYRAVSEAFIMFTTPAHGPVPEFDTGVQRIDQSIAYDGGDHFSSDAAVSFTDPSGTVLRSGCARASGTRLHD
jgi:hypothetical protein